MLVALAKPCVSPEAQEDLNINHICNGRLADSLEEWCANAARSAETISTAQILRMQALLLLRSKLPLMAGWPCSLNRFGKMYFFLSPCQLYICIFHRFFHICERSSGLKIGRCLASLRKFGFGIPRHQKCCS